MMRRLYIIRHGNTFDAGDTLLRVGARTDLALSVSGRTQAQALGRCFAGMAPNLAMLSSGPLLRTRQTASAIASALNWPDVTIDDRLTEIDYGPDEGRPEADVVSRIGAEGLAAWERDASVPPGWQVDPEALQSAWRDILSEAAARNGDTITVTSNGVARFVLPVIGAGDVPLKLKTGAWGAIDLPPGAAPQLACWNERPG